MHDVEVLIIGGGQAGLAAGFYVRNWTSSFLILERSARVGDVWRNRYDSLTLFTPRRYSSLPGMPLPGKPWGYPDKDEIADYLDEYRLRFQLPVKTCTQVHKLRKIGHEFVAETNHGAIRAQRVIVATGPFQKSYIPSFAEQLDPDVLQFHTSSYRNPRDLPQGEGEVLVVGGGNSGAQIAYELSREERVRLSVSVPIKYLPRNLLGRSLFWWYDLIRLCEQPPNSRLGRKLKGKRDPLYGFELKKAIEAGEVIVAPKAVRAEGRTVYFEDGSSSEVRAVIWGTGYRSSYSWIEIPDVLDEEGQCIVNDRGVTAVPGLCVVGLPWQTSRGSALLGWVHHDAREVASFLEKSGDLHVQAVGDTVMSGVGG